MEGEMVSNPTKQTVRTRASGNLNRFRSFKSACRVLIIFMKIEVQVSASSADYFIRRNE
tara:strand:- start:1138 stop:1314 length:177 start_codon:yes stop_codon:yes gene_type:complete